MRLHGTVDAPYTMAKRLTELSEAAPFAAIRCLSLLIQNDHDDWRPSDWVQQVRTIVGHALSCEICEAQKLATEVVHHLGAQGENNLITLSIPIIFYLVLY
jgi:hypothetical protein